ncbi:MAG: tetratricopeptide repeat protein [Lentisphaerota bacterium]
MAVTNHAKAAEFYGRMIKTYPSSPRAPSAAYGLARILQEEGNFERASAAYRKLAGDYPDSEWAPEALYASAYCRARMDQADESSKDWKNLIERFPTFGKLEEAYFRKALDEMRLDANAQARATFLDLLAKFPDTSYSGQALFYLGVLLEKEGKLGEAEKEMRASLEKTPAEKRPEIEFRLVALLQKQGKLGEASDLLQRLMDGGSLEGLSPALLEWLARYQLERKAFAEAGRAADQLVKLSPEPAWKQIGWFLLGRARMGLGQEEQARKAFEQSLKQQARTADGAESAFFLAEVQLASKDLDGAEKYYQQAAELSQGTELLSFRAKSYYGLGQVAGARGQWDQAARYYMSVAVLFDDPQLTPECLFRAAEAFGKSNRAEDQAKSMEELKTRYPESQWNQHESGMEHQVER